MKYDDLLDKQVTCTPRMLSSGDSRLCYNQLLLKFSGEELSLNDAKIIARIPAENGMVYVIDTVLLPPEE